ncbi:hypothetical protein AAKU58_004379, partial [Oxalobacteraceae bacterium GrIS 1.18]
EENGAAPTSCSEENGCSLNSLKNCLAQWVHFIYPTMAGFFLPDFLSYFLITPN